MRRVGDRRWRSLRQAISIACLALAVSGVAGAAASPLPDGRNYELVSPADSGINVAVPLPIGNGTIRATPDGRRLLYPNAIPLPDSNQGVLNTYVAERPGATGWTTRTITPPAPLPAVDGSFPNPPFLSAPYVYAISPDLTAGIVLSPYALGGAPERPGFFFEKRDLYLYRGGSPVWITQPLSLPPTEPSIAVLAEINRSGSGVHIALTSSEPEDPAYPAVTNGLYKWSEGDAHPTLISLDEDGNPVPSPLIGTGIPGGSPTTKTNAVSADGSRVVFASRVGGESDLRLFVRVGDQTVPLAETPTPNSIALAFQGASADGTRIYFVLKEQIAGTDAPPEGGLYMARVPSADPEDVEYEFITDFGGYGEATQATGTVAISSGGQHVYHVEETESGDLQLIDRDTVSGQSRVVADLVSDDFRLWQETDLARPARTTPDGEHLLFASAAPGIGNEPYDNGGHPQLFLYDAGSEEPPICVSCRPGAAPSTGPGVLSFFGTEEKPNINLPVDTRNLSADGSRAFFMTADPLAAEDSNGKYDVYEWTGGSVHLISSGRGTANSYFLDASANGDDLFFTSFESQSAAQTDGTQAIYNARVGAPPPSDSAPTAPCEGESCRVEGSGEPAFADPATAAPDGPPVKGLTVPKRLKAKGAFARIAAGFPSAGSVRLEGRHIDTSRRSVAAAGKATLSVRLSDVGKRLLVKRGSLRVKVRLTFSPRTGPPTSRSILVIFSRKGH